MIPDSCWPISFKFDVPQNVIVKADSTDTMSTVGNAAADALNNLIAALNTGGNTTMKYKAEDIMEQVKNMQKLSESTNNQLIWIASYFSPCGWYWCHEYHVGFCYGAYQRDWSEKGYRGT